MGIRTVLVILSGTVAGAVTSLAAAGACPRCVLSAAPGQPRPNPYVEARRLYRHANTLVKGIEARNQGRHFEQWKPGDQSMHRHRTRMLQGMVREHPRLADDPEANAVIVFRTAPYEQYYGSRQDGP